MIGVLCPLPPARSQPDQPTLHGVDVVAHGATVSMAAMATPAGATVSCGPVTEGCSQLPRHSPLPPAPPPGLAPCLSPEQLTGHPPYRAPQGPAVKEYLEVMRMHLTSPVPDVRAEKPDLTIARDGAGRTHGVQGSASMPKVETMSRHAPRSSGMADGALHDA